MSCLLLFGCGKVSTDSLISKYEKLLSDAKSYSLTGVMDIVSNEEVYHYNIAVDYMKDDYYRASLTNKDTNHEQIILKNKGGVYVITPSLNKSFKFQSDWPNDSSQAYILSSLLKDLKNDSNVLLEEVEDKYILSSTVNYPNNASLVCQKITFNKDMIPEVVSVFDKEGHESVTLKFSKLNFNVDMDEDYFELDSIKCEECSQTTSTLDEVVYPMYLPNGTKFKSEETVKTDDSERVILTFSGDKSFILIEEASKSGEEFEVTTTSGELVFYENVLGTLSDASFNWTMNGKDYYLIGSNLTNEELLKVAASTSVVALSK